LIRPPLGESSASKREIQTNVFEVDPNASAHFFESTFLQSCSDASALQDHPSANPHLNASITTAETRGE
jgi:hypothetical protein